MQDNPEDTDSKNQDIISTPKSPRVKVREQLRNERKLLRQLKEQLSHGELVEEDIDACKGNIEILFKELKSIEEGGHEIFLEAKKSISPKNNYSEKKSHIRYKIKSISEEIRDFEETLEKTNLQDSERKLVLTEISCLKGDLEDLNDEMDALLQFNHTRFIEAREENEKRILEVRKIEKLEMEKQEMFSQLMDLDLKTDFNDANELLAKIAQIDKVILEMRKPQEDVFLKQFEEPFKDPFLAE